jgi:hypothetical protein
MRAFVLVVAGLVLFASHAEAQVRYVDKNGVTHWVQTPEQVPPEYRGRIDQPRLPGIDVSKGEDSAARARRMLGPVRMLRGMTEYTTYNELMNDTRRWAMSDIIEVGKQLGDAIITATHACSAANKLYLRWVQDNWQKYGRRVDWQEMNLHDAHTLTQACQQSK